jgi:hypothetical protein
VATVITCPWHQKHLVPSLIDSIIKQSTFPSDIIFQERRLCYQCFSKQNNLSALDIAVFHVLYPEICWCGRPSDWNSIIGNVRQRERERERETVMYFCTIIYLWIKLMLVLLYPLILLPKRKDVPIKNLLGFQCSVSDWILIWIFWTLSSVQSLNMMVFQKP